MFGGGGIKKTRASMYQHDLRSTEGISPPSTSENLTSTAGIEVRVEPTLTRVDSIEGGPRRITRKEKLHQKINLAGQYLKNHTKQQWYGFKVAITMVLGSVPVLVGPLYDYFGVNSLWLIVSVSFEIPWQLGF